MLGLTSLSDDRVPSAAQWAGLAVGTHTVQTAYPVRSEPNQLCRITAGLGARRHACAGPSLWSGRFAVHAKGDQVVSARKPVGQKKFPVLKSCP